MMKFFKFLILFLYFSLAPSFHLTICSGANEVEEQMISLSNFYHEISITYDQENYSFLKSFNNDILKPTLYFFEWPLEYLSAWLEGYFLFYFEFSKLKRNVNDSMQ